MKNITPSHVITWICIIALLFAILYVGINTAHKKQDPAMKHYEDSLVASSNAIIIKAKADSLQAANKITALTDSNFILTQQLNGIQDETDQNDAQTIVKIKHINTLSDDSLSKLLISRFCCGFN